MMRKSNFRSIGLVAAGAIAATAMWHAFDAAVASNGDTYRQLNLFGDVFDRVRSDYVEVPDEEKLIDSAINGMLAALDPHSSYMNQKRFQDMQVQTRGEFGGLGIEVTMEDGLVQVVAPIDDTPAQRAGILSNDLITHIDGEQVLGLTLNEAVDKMRGKVDTSITLTIRRPGKDDPFDVNITRAVIRIQAVKFEREDDIGYIRITSFNEKTFDNLKRAINTLNKEIGDELKGYVIDLRNNPGGLLDQAISVSDAFLDRGEVVSTRGRNANESQRYSARDGDFTNGKPLVVLINGGSASASEIVAGALRDHERATVLGTRSFGKGSVQTIIPLGSQGALRLTTARYYTPSGTSIQATGIKPDILIEQDLPEDMEEDDARAQQRGEASLRGHLESENGEERSGSSSYIPPDKEDDKQLQAALDLLHGKTVTPTVQTVDQSAAEGATSTDEIGAPARN